MNLTKYRHYFHLQRLQPCKLMQTAISIKTNRSRHYFDNPNPNRQLQSLASIYVFTTPGRCIPMKLFITFAIHRGNAVSPTYAICAGATNATPRHRVANSTNKKPFLQMENHLQKQFPLPCHNMKPHQRTRGLLSSQISSCPPLTNSACVMAGRCRPTPLRLMRLM